MEVSLKLSLKRPKSKSNLSKPSSLPTSQPSPHISSGTSGLGILSVNVGSSLPYAEEDVISIHDGPKTKLFEKP